MKRTDVGRMAVVVLSVFALGLFFTAAMPDQVTGQTPSAADTPHKLFLPLVQKAPHRVDLGDPGPGVGMSTYRQYSEDEAVPGRILVKWRADIDVDTIAQINAQYSVQSLGMINGLAVQILQAAPEATADLLASYSSLLEVEYAEPDFIAWAQPAEPVGPLLSAEDLKPETATTNDPRIGEQYSLGKMSVNAAWDVTQGEGVVIAVLDTGYDFSHPDLQDKFVSRGRDFINNDSDATDDHGHGTHVAGIAAAATNNGVGMAGVGYNARIMPVKVLAANGSGSHGAIANGITWAADNGVKIINMSLGGTYGSSTLENAVNYAWNKGVVVIAAAGNDNSSTPTYPASYTNSIGICATDSGDRKASFSNYGVNVDVCAPGAGILGTVRGNQYQAWNGTSMASPNAAGVAALVAAANPGWTNAQIRAQLENTADNIGSSTYFGKGRLNAARAVGSGGGAPPPTPLPGPQPTSTPLPQPSVTPAPVNDYARQIVDLINQTRQQNGLQALRYDYRLKDAADFHNRWMRDNNCFSHNCPGEPDVMQRMRNANYPVISGGENIGKGFRTPQDMLNGWMNSSGHKAAILNTYWPDIGCGYLRGPSGYDFDSYWSCEFARGSDSAPPPAPTRTPVPTFTPTRTPTRTPTPIGGQPIPTQTPVAPVPPTATVPAGSGVIVVTPASNVVGWVNSAGQRAWGDDDLYAGWYASGLYLAGIQFRLDQLPANANITSAQLELTGQSLDFITPGSGATWTVNWLDPSFDGLFPASYYNNLRAAPVRHTLGAPVSIGDVGVGRKNIFVLTPQQLADLRSQKISSNRISIRIDGPTVGPNNNVMSWDSGYGSGGLGATAKPSLRIVYGP